MFYIHKSVRNECHSCWKPFWGLPIINRRWQWFKENTLFGCFSTEMLLMCLAESRESRSLMCGMLFQLSPSAGFRRPASPPTIWLVTYSNVIVSPQGRKFLKTVLYIISYDREYKAGYETMFQISAWL